MAPDSGNGRHLGLPLKGPRYLGSRGFEGLVLLGVAGAALSLGVRGAVGRAAL